VVSDLGDFAIELLICAGACQAGLAGLRKGELFGVRWQLCEREKF
jgi:hypothetical protein